MFIDGGKCFRQVIATTSSDAMIPSGPATGSTAGRVLLVGFELNTYQNVRVSLFNVGGEP